MPRNSASVSATLDFSSVTTAGDYHLAIPSLSLRSYAFKISDTSYGIFDTFTTDDARTAHINGQIPAALAEVSADLLARAPDIQPVSLLAVK